MPATRVFIFAFNHDGSVDEIAPTDWLQAWEGQGTLGPYAGKDVRWATVYLSTKRRILRLDAFKQRVTPDGALSRNDALIRGQSVWLDKTRGVKLPSEHFWEPTAVELEEIAYRLPKGLAVDKVERQRLSRDQGGYVGSFSSSITSPGPSNR